LGEAIACAERAQAAIEYCVERDPRDHRTRSLQAALLRHTAQLKQRAGDYRGAIGDLRDSLRQHRRLARWYPQEAVYRASSDWQQLIGLYQAVGDTTAARWAIPEALWELEQGLLKIDAANVSLHEFSEICHVAVSLEELLGRGLRSQVWYKRATDLCAQVAESRELTVVEQLAEVRCWYHYGRDIAESPMRAKARDRLIECETRAARLLADVPEQHEARGYLARSRSWLGRISRDARRLDDAEKWFRLAAEEYRVILKQAPHEKGFAADLATCEAFLATRQPAGVASTP
jgi:tetratricopeptide (TPR) repeat protein